MKMTKTFFDGIRELILSARAKVARGVDLVQVYTNFEIGRRIVEQEQKGRDRADYGKEVLRALSERLTREFGKGFSLSNLKSLRQFYLQNQNRIAQTVSGQLGRKLGRKGTASIGQSLIGQLGRKLGRKSSAQADPAPFSLSWTHYFFLMGIENQEERRFYEIEAAQQDWTVRELKRQFDTSLYERLALSRDKEGIRKLSREGQVLSDPQDLLKAPLVLEFLGLDEQNHYSESDLESAIIGRIEHFLLELGKGFLFEARQKRFTFDEDHFFVDLVFYNRLLRCYVLVDLKIGKLAHQDLGQMQMYVNYFDRFVKREGENSTIGIVLCQRKADALVEITLPKDANIHAKEYQLYLPGKEELRRKLVEWAREKAASPRPGTAPRLRLKTSERILRAIKGNPGITAVELSRSIGVTYQTVEWNIKRLKAAGLLNRIGPDKGGHWEAAS